MCWATGPHKLYDTIENGKIQGFDDNVLEHLIKFITLKPVDRGVDLRPNLDEEDRIGISEYIPEKPLTVTYEEVIEYTPAK